MKYFTKELYHSAQMVGRLMFPDHDADLDGARAYYRSEGRDLDREYLENFEQDRPYIEQHLPGHLVELLAANGGNSRVPSPELKAAADEWVQNWELRSRKAGENARTRYEAVKDRLPVGGRRFAEEIHLHDTVITGYSWLGTGIFQLDLNCRGGFMGLESCALIFTGVSLAEWEKDLTNNWWLYNEIDLADGEGAFELRALLDCQTLPRELNQLRITAEDVRIANPVQASSIHQLPSL
ncbi:MAG: hypothetical protein K0R57_2525 [Paenibacillaceae bacterium]|jgi:hypothetical protein|nr:hypothetical protein [Paenibacillaceae bacterium]